MTLLCVSLTGALLGTGCSDTKTSGRDNADAGTDTGGGTTDTGPTTDDGGPGDAVVPAECTGVETTLSVGVNSPATYSGTTAEQPDGTRRLGACGEYGRDPSDFSLPAQDIIAVNVTGTGEQLVVFSLNNKGTVENFDSLIQVRTDCETAPVDTGVGCYDDEDYDGEIYHAAGAHLVTAPATVYLLVTGVPDIENVTKGEYVSAGAYELTVSLETPTLPEISGVTARIDGFDVTFNITGNDEGADVTTLYIDSLTTEAGDELLVDPKTGEPFGALVTDFTPDAAEFTDSEALLDGFFWLFGVGIDPTGATRAVIRIGDSRRQTSAPFEVEIATVIRHIAGEACDDDLNLCGEDLVCAEALCTSIVRHVAGEACDDLVNQCVDTALCVDELCTTVVRHEEGGACDGAANLCLDGLVCEAMVCTLPPAVAAACDADAPSIAVATPSGTSSTVGTAMGVLDSDAEGVFTSPECYGTEFAEQRFTVDVPAGAFDLIVSVTGTVGPEDAEVPEFDSVVHIRTECAYPSTELTCNDDAEGADDFHSEAVVENAAAGTYHLFVEFLDGLVDPYEAPFTIEAKLRPVLGAGIACDVTGVDNRCSTGTCPTAGDTHVCPPATL